MIGVFWLFVFLNDFIDEMKKYLPFVFIHMAITLLLIVAVPLEITIVVGEYVKDMAPVGSLAILFFIRLYWGMIAYPFWKYSKSMTKKSAARRSRMMGAGAVFAILAYLFVILSSVYKNTTAVFMGVIFAITSGVVFYAGFVAPDLLKKMLEK